MLWPLVVVRVVSVITTVYCADLLDGDSLDPFAPIPARAPSPARPPPPAIVSSTTAPAKAEVDLFGADLFGEPDLPPPPAAPAPTAVEPANEEEEEELPAPPAELTEPPADDGGAGEEVSDEPLPPPPPQTEEEVPPAVQVDEAPPRAKSPAVPDVIPSPIPSPTPEAPAQQTDMPPPPKAASPVPVDSAAPGTDLFGGILQLHSSFFTSSSS